MAQIVVLGAGTGGMPCAYELRDQLGKEHEITLVNEREYFQFVPSNPWVAVGWRDRGDITFDIKPYVERRSINFVGKRVETIDADNSALVFEDGDVLNYDYLVIATGRTGFIPPIPGVELEGVHSLMNYETGEKLQRVMDGTKHVVIIGGGLIGLEMAIAFNEHNIDTTVVEVAPSVLPAMLDPDIIPVAPLETTAAFAAPPLNLPSMDSARFVKKLPAPALSSKAPSRTKRYTIEADTPRGIPYIPSVERVMLLRYFLRETPLNANRSGR